MFLFMCTSTNLSRRTGLGPRGLGMVFLQEFFCNSGILEQRNGKMLYSLSLHLSHEHMEPCVGEQNNNFP
jgi:hypothetical protein